MWEELLIQFCSPTLANIKTGGLFRICFDTFEEYTLWEKKQNSQLNPSGVTICSLKRTKNWVLVYVYRNHRLEQDLGVPAVREYLLKIGYPDGTPSQMLEYLRSRIQDNGDFPHEIGLFLSYPLEDVLGFVENQGRNYLYCDYWKVYHDPEKKQKIFNAFRHCCRVYEKLFHQGRSIRQLTVNTVPGV